MHDKCFRRKIRHAMASRYAYLQVGGSLASSRRFGDELKAFKTIWDDLRRVWGDLEAYDTIRVKLRWIRTDLWWILDHLGHRRRLRDDLSWLKVKIQEFRDHCDSICVDWSRFRWVGDKFGGSKENTIHYGVAFFTKLEISRIRKWWKESLGTIRDICDDIAAFVMTFEAFAGVSSQSYTTVIGSQYDC